MIRGVSLLGDELQEDLSMPASNLKDLFQKGSASLPNISQLRRNTIAKLVEEYAVKYKHGKTVNSPGNGSARQENWAPGPDALTPTSTVSIQEHFPQLSSTDRVPRSS